MDVGSGLNSHVFCGDRGVFFACFYCVWLAFFCKTIQFAGA